jgi:hypothetical protein
MATTQEPEKLLLSYLTLRIWIGILGILLPISVISYVYLFGGCGELAPSISSYYHSGMRNVFVGILCAMGVFMLTYSGFDWRDRLASSLAGIFAIGIAFFPAVTRPCCIPDDGSSNFPTIHSICGAGLFITFALMSLFLFTMSTEDEMTSKKKKRNVIYRVCGIVMLVCMGLMLIGNIINAELFPHSFFSFEATSLIAFGISWVFKGEAFLRDEENKKPTEISSSQSQ